MQQLLYYFLTLLVLIPFSEQASRRVFPPEVCNNAIDDDGDGRIDLNDEDCQCPIIEPISLIPNPSFEDQACCPPDRSRMDCASTWIQASAPTTDYLHSCGWNGWSDLPVPMPIPDGEGVIGFRNGRFASISGSATEANPNFKEYAGACLLRPLRAGVSYKFQFHIGFTNEPYSPPINVTFFGTTDCDNLPFGDLDATFGCPTNGPGWKQLGSVFASGTFEWQQVEINVTPTEDIYAIAIGPPCQTLNTSINPYYFFDNLILAEQSAFDFEIQANNQPCANDLSLNVPQYDSLKYQWYKDGIALIGETNATLENLQGDGRYQVGLESNEECSVTNTFLYIKPKKSVQISHTICQGESYLFGEKQLITAGEYWDTLKTENNCDSIIQLELAVDSSIESEVYTKIFPSETYAIGAFKFGKAGTYTETIPSSFGCDSTIHLTLEYYSIYIPTIFSPNADGVNDYFFINGGTDLALIKNIRVYNRWGSLVYEDFDLMPNGKNNGWNGQISGQIASEGVYVYTADLIMDDDKERTFSGMVTLIR